jgi:hypothetical protein
MSRFWNHSAESYPWVVQTQAKNAIGLYIWVQCSPYNDEVVDAILAYGDTLSIGDDVDYSEMNTFVSTEYGSAVTFAIGTEEDWANVDVLDITVSSDQQALFDTIKIRETP